MSVDMKPYGIRSDRLADIRVREDEAFGRRTTASRTLHERAKRVMPHGVPMQWMAGLYRHPPIMVADGDGAWFGDVDGNRYLDMNLSDYAGSLGFNCGPVADAIAARARSGLSFLLPDEDAIAASELLAERTGLPYWQFSGAASSANMEAIRIARLASGRERILMFHGRYHGHIGETLVSDADDAQPVRAMGLHSSDGSAAHCIAFNDLPELERQLRTGEFACVIAEPMLTNCNLVFPDDGFWQDARRLIHDAGCLLIADEAHTHNFAYGGLTAHWELDPDIMIIGKGMGTGVPFAVYGMSGDIGHVVERHLDVDVAAPVGVALGGTTFGNALATATARAALEHCLRREDYDRTALLGSKLESGLEKIFTGHGLDWMAPRIGGRAGWHLSSKSPRTAEDALASLDPDFVDTRRIYMANRGIWEAISSAGPSVSFAHADAEIDHYLEVAAAFVDDCLG